VLNNLCFPSPAQYLDGIFEIQKGVSLSGHVMSEPNCLTATDCVLKCVRQLECKSVNFYTTFSPGVCQLNNAKIKEFPQDIVKEEDVAYYERIVG
jgi:hypothetical protein